MNKMNAPFAALPVAITLALILGVATISGCSKDPQEKYNDAIEQLKDARASRDDAQEQLKSQKDKIADMQEELNEAKAKLAEAGQGVDSATQAVDKTVNDEVLFRTIQRELLDKKTFDKAAISVGVQNRVVTLSGNVPDEDTHQQALKAARSQAGVKNVVDQLQVQDAEAEKKQAQSDKQPDQG